MFADIGWRSQKAELHFNVTAANSNLNGPGTAPVQLLAAAPNAQFTAPNLIANTYAAANLSANIDLGDALSLQALGYYRYFQQRVVNGNAPNDTPCQDDDNAGLLCFSGGLSTTVGGGLISDFLAGGQYGQLDTQSTSTHAYGAACSSPIPASCSAATITLSSVRAWTSVGRSSMRRHSSVA